MLLVNSSLCFLQVERLQTSVAEEYTRYLNEYGARKLLLAKLNDIHNEQLNVKQHQVQGRESGSPQEPVLPRDPSAYPWVQC